MHRGRLGLVIAAGIFFAAAVEAKTPSKLLGKVFFSSEKLKDASADAVIRQFEKNTQKAELRRDKNKHWMATLVAFFKKPSVPGPVTIWIFDKADKDSIKAREPIQAISVDSPPKEIFINDLDLDPDQGYNKGHTYLFQVGQIIAKKEKLYAAGEVTLVQ
jgi:hypothetical protein